MGWFKKLLGGGNDAPKGVVLEVSDGLRAFGQREIAIAVQLRGGETEAEVREALRSYLSLVMENDTVILSAARGGGGAVAAALDQLPEHAAFAMITGRSEGELNPALRKALGEVQPPEVSAPVTFLIRRPRSQ